MASNSFQLQVATLAPMARVTNATAVNGSVAATTAATDASPRATHCQICWDAFDESDGDRGDTTPPRNKPNSRVASFCRATCPAVVCVGCLRSHVAVAIDSAFPGVLPKVRCPVCLVAVNKSKWEPLATPSAIDKYGWLCRVACAFRSPCCDNGEYTHLPFAIDAQEDEEAAQTRTLRLVPSAKRKLPALRRLCRAFCHHRADAKQVVACIEDLAEYGGDELRETLFEHVLLRVLDEERRATLLLSYHHKFKLVMTRCCLLPVCFNCKRKWDWHDGIHWDPMTCAEPEIDVDGIVECPGCHVTVVKVEGCDSVTCPCGEHFTIHSVNPFEERLDGGIFD